MYRVGTAVYLYLLLMILSAAYTSSALADDPRSETIYTSPEGISFISYSKKWNASKLESLYRTLLSCGHGEEFGLLKKVVLDPDKSTGISGYRVGNYNHEERIIRLFEVDAIPVERTLIHEYGHHFTYYWLKKQEGVYPFQLTERHEWSRLRQLDGYPVRFVGSGLPYQHKWDPGEIMAEDYVLLFGVSGQKPPADKEDIVNYLRHENEFIPSVYSLPAVREYWEKAAGFKASAVMSEPDVLETGIVEDAPGEGRAFLYVKFASAGGAAFADREPLQYGLQLFIFPSTGEAPVRITYTTSAEADEKDLEGRFPLPEMVNAKGVYYGYITVGAYHEGFKQFSNTPLYKNWFELRNDGGSKAGRMRDIPPPWEQQGLADILRQEGLVRSPMTYLFMNGRLQAAGKRYIDYDGQVYIALRALPYTKGPESAAGEPVLRRNGHEIRFPPGLELEALVDGQRISLKSGIKTVAGERFIAASELGRLLGAHAVWNDAEDSIVLEWDDSTGNQV